MLLQELTAERAYEILKRVSDEDCRVMGFNPLYAHPAWMVLTVLPVPPPAVRPSVAVDSSARQVVLSPLPVAMQLLHLLILPAQRAILVLLLQADSVVSRQSVTNAIMTFCCACWQC